MEFQQVGGMKRPMGKERGVTAQVKDRGWAGHRREEAVWSAG